MQGIGCQKIFTSLYLALISLCLCGVNGRAQENSAPVSSSSVSSDAAADVRALSGLIHDLQAEVKGLNSQLTEMRAEQLKSTEEAQALRRELDELKTHGGLPANGAENPKSAVNANQNVAYPPAPLPSGVPQEVSTPERLAKLEENQELIEAKLNDHAQTKIESGSKYRVRLSGIVLLNLYDDRGNIDNQDYPTLAKSALDDPSSVSPSSFGGSLRQSQIRLQAFGPEVAGAKTSADMQFDFAGGFPRIPNGAVMGLVRFRTGSIRLDWEKTSIVAGQDSLFFSPLAPTSIATIAVPALSYAGNLWGWTPQVRIEHRFSLPNDSSLSVQGGIMDSITGDLSYDDYARSVSWGEQSGQPVYAARIAWSHPAFGQNLTIGAGGYFGLQNWGFNRTFDGWAGTVDVTVPVGRRLEFTGAFYRGRGTGGFGGAIGQTVVLNGPFDSLTTRIRGLDSIGGWGQLKYKLKPNFEINGALGIDSPYASELRGDKPYTLYEYSYTRNLSPMLNFIYTLRSDILFSTEYRWLQTSLLDSGSNHATHVNISLGYLF